MKKKLPLTSLFVILLSLGFFYAQAQGKYQLKSPQINFFSSAPLQDIEASNKEGKGIIDFSSQSFSLRVPIKAFQFKKQLMQDHFNENYMESDKYPHGLFKGKIVGDYNLTKNGSYQITAVGDLNIHGVSHKRSILCQLLVKDGLYSIKSEFQIKLEDHQIEIPTIVFNKIAEVIDVNISSGLVKL